MNLGDGGDSSVNSSILDVNDAMAATAAIDQSASDVRDIWAQTGTAPVTGTTTAPSSGALTLTDILNTGLSIYRATQGYQLTTLPGGQRIYTSAQSAGSMNLQIGDFVQKNLAMLLFGGAALYLLMRKR